MRPLPRREMDRRSVTSRVAGTAPISASVSPAVAMAMVSQVSRSSMARNSASCAGGTKPARKRPVALRLCQSNSSEGLNSLATTIGHSTMRATTAKVTRPRQAGSGWRSE